MTEWTGVRDKRVLITGATRGIGLAAAQALARRGAQLAIVARDDARGAEAVRLIEGEGGSKVDVLHADLTSQASVRALADEALERLLAEEEEIERRTRNEHHETPHFRKESD